METTFASGLDSLLMSLSRLTKEFGASTDKLPAYAQYYIKATKQNYGFGGNPENTQIGATVNFKSHNGETFSFSPRPISVTNDNYSYGSYTVVALQMCELLGIVECQKLMSTDNPALHAVWEATLTSLELRNPGFKVKSLPLIIPFSVGSKSLPRILRAQDFQYENQMSQNLTGFVNLAGINFFTFLPDGLASTFIVPVLNDCFADDELNLMTNIRFEVLSLYFEVAGTNPLEVLDNSFKVAEVIAKLANLYDERDFTENISILALVNRFPNLPLAGTGGWCHATLGDVNTDFDLDEHCEAEGSEVSLEPSDID